MIIKSIQKKHIDGYKLLTSNEPILNLLDDKEIVSEVYFPLVSVKGKVMKPKVEVGDVVKVGQLLFVREDFYVPTYSSVSGTVKAIENMYYPLLNKKVSHLVIENDFKYQSKQVIKKLDYKKASKEKIVDAIKEAGIIGLGGAGFPTYIKYGGKALIDTILLNGVECEPYLTTDYVEMNNNIDLLLEGACILMKAASAKEVVIVFKNNKKKLKTKLEEKLVNYENIKIKEVMDYYPLGWERLLVKEVLKKEYVNIPSEVGIIVNNVQTCIGVANAFINGESITKRVVTFSGDALIQKKNVLLPIGTNIDKVIQRLKLQKLEEYILLPGGPMTSTAAEESNFALTPAIGGIIILPKLQIDTQPCLKCGNCTQTCPANLQPIEIKLAFEGLDFDRLEALHPEKCCECGLCSYVCPSQIELSDYVKKAKAFIINRNKNKKEQK